MVSPLVTVLALAATFISSVSAHTVISYPGWRGNNFHTNSSFPFGMQWMYPCGGMPTSTNRTKWPISGGALAFQPGWFSGHATALIYINLGLGTEIPNASFPMLPVFQITGPSKDLYPGTVCLPQVPLPANMTLKVGDNATIQLIETAVHGAALFNCVDITFADNNDPEIEPVTKDNCFNTSYMGFGQVYTAPNKNDAAALSRNALSLLPIVLGALFVAGW